MDKPLAVYLRFDTMTVYVSDWPPGAVPSFDQAIISYNVKIDDLILSMVKSSALLSSVIFTIIVDPDQTAPSIGSSLTLGHIQTVCMQGEICCLQQKSHLPFTVFSAGG